MGITAGPGPVHRNHAGAAAESQHANLRRAQLFKGLVGLTALVAYTSILANLLLVPHLGGPHPTLVQPFLAVGYTTIGLTYLLVIMVGTTDPGYIRPGCAVSAGIRQFLDSVPGKRLGPCRQCGVQRPPSTHHCRVCGSCCARFDHHCAVLGRCIGLRNKGLFLLLLLQGVCGLGTFMAACMCVALTEWKQTHNLNSGPLLTSLISGALVLPLWVCVTFYFLWQGLLGLMGLTHHEAIKALRRARVPETFATAAIHLCPGMTAELAAMDSEERSYGGGGFL